MNVFAFRISEALKNFRGLTNSWMNDSKRKKTFTVTKIIYISGKAEMPCVFYYLKKLPMHVELGYDIQIQTNNETVKSKQGLKQFVYVHGHMCC
jgi:hypothetical protein